MKPSDPRLRHHLLPARRPLVGVVGAGVIASVLVIAQAWAVAGLVVAVLGDGPVLASGIAVVGVLAGRAVNGAVGDRCATSAAGVVGTELRRRLVRAVVERPGSTSSAGEVSVLLTRGVAAAEPYLTRYLPALVLAAVLPALTVVAIATQDLLSAFIVLATLPLVPVFGALVGLSTRDRAEEQWREMASLSGHFLDVVRGLPTLVVHRRARAQSARIAEITDRYRQATLRTLRLAFASSAVLELVATLSVALVAVTVGVRLAGGGLGLHTALVVLLLAPEAYWPLRKVGAEFHAAAEGVAAFERAEELLGAAPPAAAAGVDASGSLVLDDVSVVHAGRSQPALASLSAVVPERGITVVTGPSGCGKSTLLATLVGLLPSSSGLISVGGLPVTDLEWRSRVAWLPQRPHFVAGSIADNLRLATPDADDDACWTALRSVALEERIRALPHGLASPLGEDGTTLSAGERARLALARVVLADRPWVLLDEPTAHLDDLTEQIIADTVATLGRDRAVVIVTHRPLLAGLADHRLELPAPAVVTAPATPPPLSTGDRTEPRAGDPVQPSTDTPVGFALATALGALASASGVALTATAGWLIVQASTHPPVLTMLVAIVGVRAFGLARPALRYVERLRSHDAALQLLARRRVQVYDALVPLTPGRLGRRRGDLLASVVDDVDSVVDRELRVRQPVRSFAAVAAIATTVAALLAPVAGLVVGGSAALAASLAFVVARHGAARAEGELVGHRGMLSERVVETVQVAEELFAWQAADRAAAAVAEISDAAARASAAASRWLAAARALSLVVTGVGIAATAWVCAPLVAAGELSGPVMALLVLLPLALGELSVPLADAGALAARTAAADARLERLEHTAPAVRDTVATGSASSHDVSVEDASVRWTPTAPATPARSLRLRPGDRVALVGSSGSGKSTVAALLLRFLDPVSGRVALGGVGLRELPLDEVRSTIGLVDDDPHVFATTLVENVRLARPEATDPDVLTALRQARLGDWVAGLPEGLHTWLGDGHSAVSGGERARLAVARSLLAGHRVLVLDEPTAHLDHATATSLAREVMSGPRSRSVLWITHGTAGLDLVDRLVDLDRVRPADWAAARQAGVAD